MFHRDLTIITNEKVSRYLCIYLLFIRLFIVSHDSQYSILAQFFYILVSFIVFLYAFSYFVLFFLFILVVLLSLLFFFKFLVFVDPHPAVRTPTPRFRNTH